MGEIVLISDDVNYWACSVFTKDISSISLAVGDSTRIVKTRTRMNDRAIRIK